MGALYLDCNFDTKDTKVLFSRKILEFLAQGDDLLNDKTVVQFSKFLKFYQKTEFSQTFMRF